MKRYTYPDEVRAALESQQQPLAVFQLVDNKIAAVLVSDGFCQLLGYKERKQAMWDMEHEMYKDTHPDDRQRISDALCCLRRVTMPNMRSFSEPRQVWIQIITLSMHTESIYIHKQVTGSHKSGIWTRVSILKVMNQPPVV